MINKEFYIVREDGVTLYRTYSDRNVYISKVGTDEIYAEAVDVEWAFYEYEETDIPIEIPEEEKDAEEFAY
jgi:hypothetical protein